MSLLTRAVLIGYARVSTDQKLELQQDALQKAGYVQRPAIINAQTCNQEISKPELNATIKLRQLELTANEPELFANEPAIIRFKQN